MSIRRVFAIRSIREILIDKSGGSLPCFYLRWILSISITEVIKQISKQKNMRLSSELCDMHKLMKDKFDRCATEWIDWTVLGEEIDSISQG